MTHTVESIDIQQVKSWWYKDGNILTDWEPNPDYIKHIKKHIQNNEYIAPVVVVKEDDVYYIVNGHHRYLAHLQLKIDKIKCILIEGSFLESEPLRKAEVLLKEFDQKTEYRYQLSCYLDRWAADAEKHEFINKYRPIYTFKFRLGRFLKKLFSKIVN